MKKSVTIIIKLFFIIAVIFLIQHFIPKPTNTQPAKTITINNIIISINILDTPQKRTQGLSGRNKLKNWEGMLFVFKNPGIYPFWMKDMKFAIDIIWIDKSLHIVDITKNASVESYPLTQFKTNEPIKYVLEINAGLADIYKIKKGDIVSF
jgi:uncharacterized membrane protein (UPF0127 family)